MKKVLKEEIELKEWFRMRYGMAHAPRRNELITAYGKAVREDERKKKKRKKRRTVGKPLMWSDNRGRTPGSSGLGIDDK